MFKTMAKKMGKGKDKKDPKKDPKMDKKEKMREMKKAKSANFMRDPMNAKGFPAKKKKKGKKK